MPLSLQRAVRGMFARAGVHVHRLDRQNADDFFLAVLERRLRQVRRDFFFVQIGANDGVSMDSLHAFVHQHGLAGVVVEPLPDMFELLRRNYAALPQVKPVEAALHRSAREIELYRVSPSAAGLPDWAKGIASLDPEHHKRCGIASEHIITQKVRCLTWAELVREQAITRIDLLQIDTEGYDYEILKMVDFAALKPAIVKFEHALPRGHMTPAVLGEALGWLASLGYLLITTEFDAIAYLP